MMWLYSKTVQEVFVSGFHENCQLNQKTPLLYSRMNTETQNLTKHNCKYAFLMLLILPWQCMDGESLLERS